MSTNTDDVFAAWDAAADSYAASPHAYRPPTPEQVEESKRRHPSNYKPEERA